MTEKLGTPRPPDPIPTHPQPPSSALPVGKTLGTTCPGDFGGRLEPIVLI